MQKPLRFLLLLFILLTNYTLSSQKKTKQISGKIKSLNNDVSNVLIINLNSKESTITDSLGVFTIEAKLRDSIRFTAVQYLTKEIVITETIFQRNLVVVNLVENIINLNEVTVTPYNLSSKLEQDINSLGIEPVVTSSTLGLPNADVKVMPQSERLLLVADRGEYARLMTIEEILKLDKTLLGFFKISVMVNSDKTINRISGKTKSLEEIVIREKNIELEKEIIAKFSKKTMSENFDIPEVNIDGFLTFCMSQKDFSEISKSGNMLSIWEYLKIKSIEFKEQ
ncbi:hypothetical protein [Maribacter sp. IgM3_T14_3]|uniref:hypothetical protein n=1 Tax=Maribacter sp. IgM3_T14_3 TaxID=3415140 RepID=UPI003C6F83B1